MKHLLGFVVVLISGVCVAGDGASVMAVRTVAEPVGWRFFKGASTEGRRVTIPHDWGIEGDFLRTKDGKFADFATGALPWRGFGRYEATFTRRRADSSVYLVFDGVMANPKVSVNGRNVGGWDYGYASFTLDVTRFAAVGENRLAVSADTRAHASRWYPGGGMIRPVRVVEMTGLHVLPDTMSITTPDVTAERAVVAVSCETTDGPTNFTFEVKSPRLWDVDDPYLYELKFLGETFRYGIRTFAWTANDGFHLNGRRLQVKGANLHADLGPLGMAFHRDAARRQLLLMRDMGVNAIRTSHNPPAPEFLDLCDEMGFVVWNECFDEWRATADNPASSPWDVSLKKNLRAFVARDRNHPSVVAWSIGNEIKVCGADGREKGRNQLTRDRVRELADFVRRLDPTRPVAMGCHPGTNGFAKDGIWSDLDLVGWNYRESYREMRAAVPTMPLVISESASAVSSAAGWYEEVPANRKYDYFTNVVECSGYDRQTGKTLDVPDTEFCRVERDRYLAGEFVWTGIDYLGEPTPFWDGSARSSYFGACDLCGFPKDRFYLYRSVWNAAAETVRIVPNHWNWTRRNVPVYVYTSGDEAELFLNGRSLGRRKKDRATRVDTTPRKETIDEATLRRYRLMWDEVLWEPGELKVVAYRDGRPVGQSLIRTAGEPVRVSVTRDPHSPPGGELAFWRISLVDANGIEVPNRNDRLAFALEGEGKIVAVGNGNAHGADAFARTETHPLFCGQALVVVRKTGAYRLKAEVADSKGIEPGIEGCK